MTDDHTTNDEALWRQETQDVKPLNQKSSIKELKPLKIKEKNKKADRLVLKEDLAKTPEKPRSNDIDARTLQRLKRGQIKIEARLDLHGMNRHQAYDALYPFLSQAQNTGKRCVLVITGKGQKGYEMQGILRNALPEFLSEPRYNPIVLTHAPAQPRDGGTGAFYIYLRRKK